MRASYRATYSDSHGDIPTVIENDGRTLRMLLAGIAFEGSDFDSLSPVHAGDLAQSSRFTFADGVLCACSLALEIPVVVLAGTGDVAATLEVALRLGSPRHGGRLEEVCLRLLLVLGNTRLASNGRSGWFEDELADLQSRLPRDWFLKMCFACGLSDYSPYGHGLFGGLACFRDNKAGYRAVATKADLFRVWDTMTELVQETHLCSEFEKRKAGDGYRG